MLIRQKILEKYPVFSTPNLKLWTKQLKGYTGQNSDGYFENEQGVTGCTANPGVGSDFVVYESEFIAEIPGDEVAYFADYEPGTEPDLKRVVSGTLIIPEKYKGIKFDNTVIGEDGKLFYQFVKGNIPDSVTPFVAAYNFRPPESFPVYIRPLIETSPFDGMTAGDNYEKNVSLFPVYYTNYINETHKDPKKEIIFSFDQPVTIQPGQWNTSKTTGRCSPCRISWPPGNGWGGELCYQGIDAECGGIPYAYFQTLPETVYILTLNLSLCKDENDKQFITITDTGIGAIKQFSYQKVIVDSTVSNCDLTEYPDDCRDENTVTDIFCNTGESRTQPPTAECDPLKGLAKGYRQTDPTCTKLAVVPCEEINPCDGINCELQCPSKEYRIIFRTQESLFQCPPNDICPGGYIEFYSGGLPYWVDIFDMSNPSRVQQYIYEKTVTCNYYQESTDIGDCFGYSKNVCSEYSIQTPSCGFNPITVQIPWTYKNILSDAACENTTTDEGTLGYLEYGEFPACPGTSDSTTGASCCCCGYNRDGESCDQQNPDNNVAFIQWAGKTSYVPNPFLMYLNNGAYFIGDKINFGKYIDNYFTVWSNYVQEFYPDVNSFKSYFKNPECNNLYPEYFFANFDLEKSTAGLTYDTKICNIRYDKISNPSVPCNPIFKLPKFNSVGCGTNIKHPKLENYSYNLACLEQQEKPDAYSTDTSWKKLTNTWTMKEIPFYGICNGEGITLDIQMPEGLTLSDCTNVLSWEFLKNAPK